MKPRFHAFQQPARNGEPGAALCAEAPLTIRRSVRLPVADRNIGPAARLGLELHNALAFSEDRMVAPNADAFAGMPLCAALAQNDVPRSNLFAAELFDAE